MPSKLENSAALRTFTSYPLTQALLDDFTATPFPTTLSAWNRAQLKMAHGATHFGYVYSDYATLLCASGTFHVRTGMYFSVPGSASIEGGAGIIISRLNYNGFFQLGGPVESEGR